MRALRLGSCVSAFGLAILYCAAAAAAPPASPDVETLITAPLSPDTGIALARAQIADRDLLGAAGTLERVVLAHPEAVAPRLLYASLLCRLDDVEGAQVEVAALNGTPYAEADWTEVTRACGNIARPAAPRGKRR